MAHKREEQEIRKRSINRVPCAASPDVTGV